MLKRMHKNRSCAERSNPSCRPCRVRIHVTSGPSDSAWESESSRPRCTRKGQTKLRCTGFRINEKWHVPEMDTAQFHPKNLPSNWQTALWKDQTSTLFQVFASPGKSSSDEDYMLLLRVNCLTGTSARACPVMATVARYGY